MKNAKKAPKTVAERGYAEGQRWIETEGAAACSDAEMRDAAKEGSFWYENEADRVAYVDGFLAGVASMLLVG